MNQVAASAGDAPDRPAPIRVTLTRDSLSAGDDLHDHTKTITVRYPGLTVPEIIRHIAMDYLPKAALLSGGWDCTLNGTSCAVISGSSWDVTEVAAASFDQPRNELYFHYRCVVTD